MKRDFAVAVKAIIKKDDKFLVLHRSKEEIAGSVMNRHEPWDLPGGGVHFFETTEKALFREIKEETGLKVRLVHLNTCYDVMRTNLHMIILTYVCEYIYGEVTLSSEHDEFYWLTLEEMERKDLPNWMIRDFKVLLENK